MSNKSRKNKNSQSPKQETERAQWDMENKKETDLCPKCTQVKTEKGKLCPDCDETKTEASADKKGAKAIRLPDEPFSFETTLKKVDKPMQEVVIVLHAIADKLNTETIFGIPAARFQAMADKINKYPKQLKAKAAKERRQLTQTETKEERKDKKAKTLRNRIAAMQTKLAEL